MYTILAYIFSIILHIHISQLSGNHPVCISKVICITYYLCYFYRVFCMMQYRYGKHRSYSQAQIIQVPVIEVEGIDIHV